MIRIPMKRPWQVWLAFSLCGGVLVAAMSWLTAHAVRVDRERSAARAEAELEQRVSLALWRMDTKLAPLIAEEVARPSTFYDSFITVGSAAKGVAAEQVPSPLLTRPPSNVILNFDASLDGRWKSPQAPPAEQTALALSNGLSPSLIASNRRRLVQLSKTIDVRSLAERLPVQPLPTVQDSGQVPFEDAGATRDAGNGAPTVFQQSLAARAFSPSYDAPGVPPAPADRADQPPPAQRSKLDSLKKNAKGVDDFGERTGRLQQAAQQELSKFRAASSYLAQNAAAIATPAIENVSRPLWVGEQLLLARRVERGGRTFVQGSWLDWPRLKRQLLAETADLLPEADLRPVHSHDEMEPTRLLAGLPVQLIVSDTQAALSRAKAVDAPLHWALGVGWAALLLALLAVAGLLAGVLNLSERRAAFVSSVTHELRTPLTTFRMYAEMLARDMVPSAQRRQEYLETLTSESERLTHLVENVLSYARLERGRRPKRNEPTTPGALVERFKPRLVERAARAQMLLECNVEEGASDVRLLTDVGVVEQILFNLVDNAAKYAARADDRRILLRVTRDRDGADFCVSDHGPGFASFRAAERLAAFSKSAQEAAETAPGVGLGLALCRRLARQLGGRLEIRPSSDAAPGACVVLRLPIER